MERDFGRKDPTLAEALRANPSAFSQHVGWNCQLLPSGLQFGMFSRYYGKITPDFGAMKGGSTVALVLSCIVVFAILLATWLICTRRRTRELVGRFVRRGAGTWIALGCMMPSVFLAIFTQRPRPSYIFPLSFLFMLVTLFCIRLLIRNEILNFISRRTAHLGIFVLGGLLTAAVPATGRPAKNDRPLHDDYRRIKPYRSSLHLATGAFCSDTAWGDELSNYLSEGISKRIPVVSMESLIAGGLREGLKKKGVRTVYLREKSLLRPEVAEWRKSAQLDDWRVVATSKDSNSGWELWSKESE